MWTCRARLLLLLLTASALQPACSGGDEVNVTVLAPPGFDTIGVAALAVEVETSVETLSLTFLLDGEFDDGETSFVIRPGDYEGPVTVRVSATTPGGAALAGMGDTDIPASREGLMIELVCVSGCGGSTDAGTDGGGEAGPCVSTFGPPTHLSELESSNVELGPTVSADELEIFFDSSGFGGPGGEDILRAERTSATLPFGNIVPIGLNTSSDEVAPHLFADGLSLLFASGEAAGGGDLNLFWAVRPSVADSFGGVSALAELNTGARESHPAMAPGALEIYFESDRPGGTGSCDIYRASRAVDTDPFSNIENVAPINTSSCDTDPFVTADGRTLYFASNRDGTHDLYFASRFDLSTPWGPPVAMDELNTSNHERGPFLSADGLTLYYSSDQFGDQDLWLATRECAP